MFQTNQQYKRQHVAQWLCGAKRRQYWQIHIRFCETDFYKIFLIFYLSVGDEKTTVYTLVNGRRITHQKQQILGKKVDITLQHIDILA